MMSTKKFDCIEIFRTFESLFLFSFLENFKGEILSAYELIAECSLKYD
jgi:hypothetical protein